MLESSGFPTRALRYFPTTVDGLSPADRGQRTDEEATNQTTDRATMRANVVLV